MNAALVPVRSLAGAKKRLAMTLSGDDREQLALAMLEDMLEALTAAASLERVVVVSADADLLETARSHGADIMHESEPAGLNAAVRGAAGQLEAEGVERLLTIPGDVPLLDSAEIDRVFATDARQYPVVLVPSAAGTGTNGLLMSPPSIIAPHFEGLSLAAHRRACNEAGITPLILELGGFALDIDTSADLATLVARGGGRRSARLASIQQCSASENAA